MIDALSMAVNDGLTLDAENAFKSANWDGIERVLADIGIPGYSANLVENYLSTGLMRPRRVYRHGGSTTGISISSLVVPLPTLQMI